MLKSDLYDLNNLVHCEIIRYLLKENQLFFYVVGDNEEDAVCDHHDDEEGGDCCDGLNGHLFLLVFQEVHDFQVKGEECDNYKTINVIHEEKSLKLSLEGYNFIDGGNDVEISFGFSSYKVEDKGEIEGPDA